VGVGVMAGTAVEVAERLAAQDIGATVVDPRWVKPVPQELLDLAARHRLVVTIEDNGVVGGVGCAVADHLRDAGSSVQVRTIGVPQRFLDHDTRAHILEEVGLTAQGIGHRVIGWISAATANASLTDELGEPAE
jgi:1-deoxy-D-xylulose-5-phosphate synthase